MRSGAAIALLIAGCTPTPAFVLADTPETLGKRDVALSGGAGVGLGGSGGSPITEAGGMARVRVGVGGNQEVSMEAAAVGGSNWSVAGRVGWKLAPLDRLALLVGAGATVTNGNWPAVGGDVSLVTATLPRPHRLYGGVRLTVGVPARSDPYSDGGLTFAAILPVGGAFAPHPNLRMFLEGGFIASVSTIHNIDQRLTGLERVGFYGGYLAFIPTGIFRRR